jgi:hypothetical protein
MSPSQQIRRRIVYHAFGAAARGRITRPFHCDIQPQAFLELPPAGGYFRNGVRDFDFEGAIQFDRAETIVTGSQSQRDKSWTALVTLRIEGLNILNVVKAESIVLRLNSLVPFKPDDQAEVDKQEHSQPGFYDSRISPLGSHFEGLRVAGRSLRMQWDMDLFCRYERHRDLIGAIEGCGPFEELPNRQLDPAHGRDAHPERPLPEEYKNPVALTAVRNLHVPGCFHPVGRHGIHVPEFGRIFLGEFFSSPRARRLTMLRLELGCGLEGSLACAEGGVDTHTEP